VAGDPTGAYLMCIVRVYCGHIHVALGRGKGEKETLGPDARPIGKPVMNARVGYTLSGKGQERNTREHR
jgi:hypothetical protein